VDPEMEAHLDEQEAEYQEEYSGSEEEEDEDYYDDDVWHEGDPDVLCPFCGSGLRTEKVCSVCGRSPNEAKAGVPDATPLPLRLLKALVDGKHLELSGARALRAVGAAIADTL